MDQSDDSAPRDAAGEPTAAAGALTEREVAILAFEGHWFAHAGAKEQAIRAELGLSAARYYQVLGAVINRPEALAHDPMLVKRLLRMREARAHARARRSLGGQGSL